MKWFITYKLFECLPENITVEANSRPEALSMAKDLIPEYKMVGFNFLDCVRLAPERDISFKNNSQL